MEIRTEVLIIGGGATGVGTARDLALRGIPCLLIDKGDLTSGASGRNHGLLHSGGRYAVSDSGAARECISENKILKRIAPHCIEDTGGLFISLPQDGLDFRDRFLVACEKAGIGTAVLSASQALALEPNLDPSLLGAVEVPDGSIEPFRLVAENALDAENHGARFLLHTEMTSPILDGGRVRGIKAKDRLSGEDHLIRASYLINATGAWAKQFLKHVGLPLNMALSKGTLLVTNVRMSQRVINRCRKASDGDIVVPNDLVSILGTTSVRLEDVENFEVTPPEVTLLVEETSKMIPQIKDARFIRAYAGIRPLIQSEATGDDRAISRGFILIDHAERDGLQNLITITGGKFVTYRLMAEKTTDLICRKMGIDKLCSTHLQPLPGAGQPAGLRERLRKFSVEKGETLCDCELIQRQEVEKFLKEGRVKELGDILHRTRLAKGTCQGGFCVYRLLGVFHELGLGGDDPNKVLKEFLEERWKGIRPVLWGTSMKEHELLESIYKGMFDL